MNEEIEISNSLPENHDARIFLTTGTTYINPPEPGKLQIGIRPTDDLLSMYGLSVDLA